MSFGSIAFCSSTINFKHEKISQYAESFFILFTPNAQFQPNNLCYPSATQTNIFKLKSLKSTANLMIYMAPPYGLEPQTP